MVHRSTTAKLLVGFGVSMGVCVPAVSQCPLNFAAPVAYTVGTQPIAIVVGDFSGDAKLDLVVMNYSATTSNTLSLLMGNGDGTFQPAVSRTASAPQSMVAADYNMDGKLDLAVFEWNGGLFFWPGVGDGTFGDPVISGCGTYEQSAATGDFNLDGNLDLVTASNSGGRVYLGNGLGVFTDASCCGGSITRSVATGDFNSDGKPDVISAGPPNGGTPFVGLLLGNGNGTFQSLALTEVGQDPESVAVGDFNRDGKLDVASANDYANSVGVLLGAGDGTFLPAATYPGFPNSGQSPIFVIARDLDGDLNLDLAIVSGRDNSSVRVMQGKRSGKFLAATVLPAGMTPQSIATGDFNRDGKVDLAVADSQNAGKIQILLNQSSGIPDPCASDFDCSGSTTIDDLFGYLNAWFLQLPRSDFDGVNGTAIDDLFLFLNQWFNGC